MSATVAIESKLNTQTGICFFRVPHDRIGLCEFLMQVDLQLLFPTQIDEPTIAKWLFKGAVYIDGRRVREDIELKQNQILRLHTRSKRYLVPASIQDRIIYSQNDFLVLDKPAGLPTHPTLDNYTENAKYLLEQALGVNVYVTHRLDVQTEGLLIFALSTKLQAQINKVFAKGRVKKFYEAFHETNLPLGEHTHYMDPEGRVPRQALHSAQAGFWQCKMSVLTSEPAGLPETIKKTKPTFFKHKILLQTGKTHQIRAQSVALGAPVVGDTTYGSSLRWPNSGIALACVEMSCDYLFPAVFRREKFSLLNAI